MELLTRGTKTRSAEQIAEFWDSIGGDINTSCGNNSWSWNATCLKENLPQAIEAYADVVNNPIFPQDELTPMKQRIGAAIAAQDADWYAQAMRFFKKAFYGPQNSPYQFQVIGTADNLPTFTQPQLQDWYQQHVLRARRVLAIYGDIDVQQARQLAERYLGGGPTVATQTPVPAQPQLAAQTDQPTPAVNVQRVEVQQTQQPLAGIVIGFDSRSVIGDPSNFPLTVAQTMAGGFGYPTGYLFETLRGHGLVYVVQDVNWPGRSTQTPGGFYVVAGCDPRNVNRVLDLMLENIARLQGSEADLQPSWYERSKQLITTADAMQNETASEQATTAALDELFGLGYNYHDSFAQRIDAVSLSQVQQIARQRLRDCTVTISTPATQLVEAKPGVRQYQSFPPVELTPRGVQHDVGGDASK
jgi:zinc protease